MQKIKFILLLLITASCMAATYYATTWSGTSSNQMVTRAATFAAAVSSTGVINANNIGGNIRVASSGSTNTTDGAIFTTSNLIFFSNWAANAGFSINTSTAAITALGSGSITAGAFFESSDIRQKTVHQTAMSADGIDAIQYTFNPTGTDKWGYSAQQVKTILPYAVTQGSDGFFKLDYTTVHTYKIAELEKRIFQLEKMVNAKN
jgi:hypothetical protein